MGISEGGAGGPYNVVDELKAMSTEEFKRFVTDVVLERAMKDEAYAAQLAGALGGHLDGEELPLKVDKLPENLKSAYNFLEKEGGSVPDEGLEYLTRERLDTLKFFGLVEHNEEEGVYTIKRRSLQEAEKDI